MAWYKVTIKERLERDICVETDSMVSALESVRKSYRDGVIVLGADDFTGGTIFDAVEITDLLEEGEMSNGRS